MKKNSKLEERRKQIPEDVKVFVDSNFAIAEQIDIILQKKKWTQKDLADTLGKTESEISKWLSGTHNFTQRTLAKIHVALGEPVTVCPKDVKIQYNILYFSPTQYVLAEIPKGDQNKNSKKCELNLFTTSTEVLNECDTENYTTLQLN